MGRLFFHLTISFIAVISFTSWSFAAFPSDINQDDNISLQDIIIGLRLISGEDPDIPVFADEVDVDGDGRIGFAEVLDGLRTISEYGEFGVVTSAGQVWMDRNLGASQVATSSTDSLAYGDLYQWGRGTDGHEKRTSGITSINATSDTPGHGLFITESSTPYDWRVPQNNTLWQGVSGVNNPCPAGFRLPTETELETERTSWSTNNAAGAYASPLKLVVAGYRRRNDGAVLNAGSGGNYWSATVHGSSSRYLLFNSSNANMSSYNRAYGFSVRCIEDQ